MRAGFRLNSGKFAARVKGLDQHFFHQIGQLVLATEKEGGVQHFRVIRREVGDTASGDDRTDNCPVRIFHTDLQHFGNLRQKFSPGDTDMSGLADLFQRITHARNKAFGIVQPDSGVPRDLIRKQKTDPPHIRSETVRVLPDLLCGAVAVKFIDPGEIGRSDPKTFQKDPQLPFVIMFLPCSSDGIDFFLGETFDRKKFTRFVIQYIQRFRSELIHDRLRRFRSDAGNDAGGKIAHDPFRRGRQGEIAGTDPQLQAVFRINFPLAFQFHTLPFRDARHGADRHKLFAPAIHDPDHAVGFIFGGIDDMRDFAAERTGFRDRSFEVTLRFGSAAVSGGTETHIASKKDQ